MLLTGIRQFQIDRLTLRHHGLLRVGTQMVGLALRLGLHGIRLFRSLGQQTFRLRVGLVGDVLGVDLRVVQQGFGLKLHVRTHGGGVLLGTGEQFGARLLRAGEHLLRVRAQGSEGIRIGLLVLLLLQLALQFENRPVVGLDLFTKTVQRLLCRGERLVDPFLVIPPQHDWELIHHSDSFREFPSMRICQRLSD